MFEHAHGNDPVKLFAAPGQLAIIDQLERNAIGDSGRFGALLRQGQLLAR